MMSNHHKKTRWRLIALLIVLAAGALALSCINICPLIEAFFPSFHLTRSGIAEFIRSLGGWGVVASVGLMILHSFVPFPAELLAMANGMVYGPFWGTAVTWMGAMLGAYASFGLARLLGRPFVKRIVDEKKLDKIDNWTKNRGNVPLLLSRLIPLIAFNLINYAAGLTRISWWTFTWTTAIGILPMTVLIVAMGNSINILPLWGWVLVLVFMGAAIYGLGRFGKLSENKTVQ
ncbi:MAG: TVP38/TMEM64 family protein [Desulfobacterales bacterium]|nr:TVP38/TMEM64 family protein [Desulfobacterales bacterium]